MKSTSILLGAMLAALPLQAQTAQHITATKANDYALAYSLPNTIIDVTIEAEITVKKPGEFYRYSPKYLNINNPISAEQHSARVLSAVISSHGVPDPDNLFNITFKSGSPVDVYLTGSGIPLAINTTETQKPAPLELPEARKAAPTPLETPVARQVVSEEMMQSKSTAKRAELAAQAIFALRQTRSELISGQAETMPPDGKSLQLMLDNMQAQEDALMAMFVGTTSTSTQVETFQIDPELIPADSDELRVIVARVSAIDGIVSTDDLSGTPVYVDLSVINRGETPVNEKGQQLPFPKNGVPYAIPGQLSATVSYDGQEIASRTINVSQLGLVYGLAPNSFTNKKAPIFVLFDPTTGAILRQGPANR